MISLCRAIGFAGKLAVDIPVHLVVARIVFRVQQVAKGQRIIHGFTIIYSGGVYAAIFIIGIALVTGGDDKARGERCSKMVLEVSGNDTPAIARCVHQQVGLGLVRRHSYVRTLAIYCHPEMGIFAICGIKAVFGIQVYAVEDVRVGNALLRCFGAVIGCAAMVVGDKVERQVLFMNIR